MTFGILIGDVELGPRVSLVGGLAIPVHRRLVVSVDFLAVPVHISKSDLGVAVTET